MKLSWSRALCLEHVWQAFDTREYAAQLRKITDLDHQLDISNCAIEVDRHIGNIDIFGLQQRGDVSHQSLTVISLDGDVHREGSLYLAPIHLQEAFGVFAAQNVG